MGIVHGPKGFDNGSNGCYSGVPFNEYSVMWTVGKNGFTPLAQFADEALAAEYIGKVLLQIDPEGVNNGDYYLDAPTCKSDVMGLAEQSAKLLNSIDQDVSCKWLGLEWTSDFLVTDIIDDHMDLVWKLYDMLEPYTLADRFEYNDLDNHAFRINWNDSNSKAFVHTCQNRNVVYVLSGGIDSSMVGDNAKYADSRRLFIYEYQQEYNAPDLPTLDEMIEVGGSKYNDSRDPSYVGCSRNLFVNSPGKYTIMNVNRIKMALFNLETLDCGLEEENV